MSLAENHVISNQLQNTVVGKTIVKTVANQNPHGFVWFATGPRFAFAAPEISHRQAEQYEALLTGKPCARCGAPIVKEAYLGGVVYYCPGCQPIVV